VIDKPGYGAFHKTTLGALLGAFGIDRLLLCGVTTEVCVHSTLREAIDRGFVCTTVGDATAASQAELQAPALAMIGSKAASSATCAAPPRPSRRSTPCRARTGRRHDLVDRPARPR
jgi:nicotinamidase-related amidase